LDVSWSAKASPIPDMNFRRQRRFNLTSLSTIRQSLGGRAVQRFGVILAAKDSAIIFPFRTTKVAPNAIAAAQQ
jgi:hypothetical protein